MKKTIMKGCGIVLLFALLIAKTNESVFATADANAGNADGKQIVFMVDGPDLKLTDVKISGTNQDNQFVTWEKHDTNGFKLAYTKDWWWSENFVRIDFSIQDDQSQTSYSKTCVIDVLEQPTDSPRVEITYFKDQGCVGGEAGNSNSPVTDNQSAKQIQSAFKTIEFYTSDFNMDKFITTFGSTAVDFTKCSLAVGEAISTFGPIGFSSALTQDDVFDCGASISDIKEVLFPED